GEPNQLLTVFNRPGEPGIHAHEATTAAGDSGGPLFLGDAVAGITSWGSSGSSRYGDMARYTRVSFHKSWISNVMRSTEAARRVAREGRVGQPINLAVSQWSLSDGLVEGADVLGGMRSRGGIHGIGAPGG